MRKLVNGTYMDMTPEEIEEIENLEEVDVTNPNNPWRTIREFTIQDEAGVAEDTSDITWTLDDSGNITAFEFDTDSDGNIFSTKKMKICIFSPDIYSKCFGGNDGYLSFYINKSDVYSTFISGAKTKGGYQIDTEIYQSISGQLLQIAYMGENRNSYGNERVHFARLSNNTTLGRAPISALKIACTSNSSYIAKGAKVIVQIYEEES